MASIDLDALLRPVADDQPGGPSLDGDSEYLGLEIAATRKPEIEVGGVVTPAEDPDWPAVQEAAQALLERSKDVQVTILLTEALIHNDGLKGMHAGLDLIHGLLDNYWDHLHPELDPDDPDGAASMRMMRLKNLGDRSRIVRALRTMPLVESRLHGKFSLADVKAIAKGLQEGEGGASERQAALQDSLRTAEGGELLAQLAEADACRECLAAIIDLVDERSDVREDLGVAPLDDVLGDIRMLLDEQVSARGLQPTVEASADAQDEAAESAANGGDIVPPSSGQAAPAAPAAARGPITSREDAVKCLDQVCHYFEQHEPSSPVPLLLGRAKRLVSKDFMAILADLAPEGMDDARRVVGEASVSSSEDE